MLILWKRYPFILWNSLILAFNRKNSVSFAKKSLFSLSAPFILWKSIPFFYGNIPFILWKCSLYSMEISLYSMEKLSHPACSKGSRLRKRLFKTILKYFKGEAVLSDADFCRLTRRNLLLLAAGAKKA